jgi:hypothetical protein
MQPASGDTTGFARSYDLPLRVDCEPSVRTGSFADSLLSLEGLDHLARMAPPLAWIQGVRSRTALANSVAERTICTALGTVKSVSEVPIQSGSHSRTPPNDRPVSHTRVSRPSRPSNVSWSLGACSISMNHDPKEPS